jgi:hypothetical protein
VLTMKVTSFWNVTPCGLVDVYRHFEETTSSISRVKEYVKIATSKKQTEPSVRCFLLSGCLPGLLFDSEDGGHTFSEM